MSETHENPLMEKLRIPGATFKLPSQGLFYENGELAPDVKHGELEVYPMTAMDEIVFSTPDKLLSGKAIVEVFSRCIPQILKPTELLSKDVDYLMICLRMVSFEGTMEAFFTHDCEHAKKHSYQIDLNEIIRSAKMVDPTIVKDEYRLTMTNGQVVTLKPLTYQHIVELYQTTALTKRNELTEEEAIKLVVDTITGVIRSVDTITDKDQIRQWVLAVPLGWKRQIEQAAQRVSQWGVDGIVHRACLDCGGAIELYINANPVSFFT